MKKEIQIYIDSINDDYIQGWFINLPAPENNKLLLYLDKKYKAVTEAKIERQDVEGEHGQLHSGYYFDIKKFSSFKLLELKSEKKEILLSLPIKNKKTGGRKSSVNLIPPPYSLKPYKKLNFLKVDLSRHINGDNWYPIEPTGRWGGPELESTIQIPALSLGKYRLEIEIGNDFCGLETLDIMLNDKKIDILSEEYQAPVTLQAEIEVEQERPFWQLKFKYPKTSAPEGEIGADQRKLAIFLKTVSFNKLTSSPSSVAL